MAVKALMKSELPAKPWMSGRNPGLYGCPRQYLGGPVSSGHGPAGLQKASPSPNAILRQPLRSLHWPRSIHDDVVLDEADTAGAL